MDTKMIECLTNLEGEKTIYFRKRTLQTDRLDLKNYQIVSEYLKRFESEKSEKGNEYYQLLRAWYYTLLRLKEEELSEIFDPEAEERLFYFYEQFQKRTEELSKEEKIQLLYRYPWHVRTMLIASRGKFLNTDYIHQVASMKEMTELDISELSYLAVTKYDSWALKTIQDDIELNHIEELTYQVTKNLHTMIHGYNNVREIIKAGKDQISKEDQHAFNIIAFLYIMHNKEKIEVDLFDYYLFALSSICFWHFEANVIKPIWYIKKGKFKHLKSIREKMRGLL